MLSRDAVLNALRMRGPSLPVQIKKILGEGDSFMIGALLSELSQAGKIKISNVKRGGSPFYYVPEHASRLAAFVSDLGEKDRRAAELLREQKILRDSEQNPLIRVCLRQIKDFAIPIDVKRNGTQDLFWKWYLTPNDEAEKLVKQSLGIKIAEIAKPTPAQAASPEQRTTTSSQPSVATPQQQASTPKPTPLQKAPKPEAKQQPRSPTAKPQPAAKVLKKHDDTGDDFLKTVLNYFGEKHIQIIEKKIVRKNGEIDFEVSLPTAVGRVNYFCKAKKKKKCNDGDLSSAYLQAQTKRLPAMFITPGDVTKKAKEKIKTDFKGLVLVQLDK